MVALTKTTILQNSWKNIYNLISNNVSDPESRASGTRWITNSFPDLLKSKFPNYPIIIIESPTISNPNSTFGRGKSEVDLTFVIYIYTKKNEQLDTVGDDLKDAITANQQTTETDGMFSPNITAGTIGSDVIGKDKVHFRTLTVSYMYYSDV